MITSTKSAWFENAQYWGILPELISGLDPRPIHKQIDTNYIGGWSPLSGFKVNLDEDGFPVTLEYESDPVLKRLGRMALDRDGAVEKAAIFDGEWLAAQDADGNWAVTRVD